MSSSRAGNALFLVLIAVALFAALSYAMTQTSRGSGNTSKESAVLDAGRVMQYATGLEQKVNAARLIDKCADTEISFQNSIDAAYTYATRTECKIFDPLGGGATFTPTFTLGGLTATGRFTVMHIPGIGTGPLTCCGSVASEWDILYILQNIPQDVCSKINAAVGISGIPADDQVNAAKFAGAFAGGTVFATVSDPVPNRYIRNGCIQVAATYYYYHVMFER